MRRSGHLVRMSPGLFPAGEVFQACPVRTRPRDPQHIARLAWEHLSSWWEWPTQIRWRWHVTEMSSHQFTNISLTNFTILRHQLSSSSSVDSYTKALKHTRQIPTKIRPGARREAPGADKGPSGVGLKPMSTYWKRKCMITSKPF